MAGSDDRDTPVDPIRRRTPTLKGAAGMPRVGAAPRPIPREEPDLSATTAEGADPRPWPKSPRRHSPPPQELPPPTSAQYGQRVAELSTIAQEAQERAERAERELARERRKSAPRVESEPQPSLPPKDGALVVTRREVRIPTWMIGAAISALGLGSWQAWEQIRATPAKVEAVEKRMAAEESRMHAAEDALSTLRAENVHQRAVNKALECQFRHVRAAFERSGVTLDALPRGGVDWRSEYLPDSRRVRTAPAWRAVDDCPGLPGEP